MSNLWYFWRVADEFSYLHYSNPSPSWHVSLYFPLHKHANRGLHSFVRPEDRTENEENIFVCYILIFLAWVIHLNAWSEIVGACLMKHIPYDVLYLSYASRVISSPGLRRPILIFNFFSLLNTVYHRSSRPRYTAGLRKGKEANDLAHSSSQGVLARGKSGYVAHSTQCRASFAN